MPPCPGQFSTVIVDAFLPRNNLSSCISPMLIPVTRQEIWDEVFGISSIHMVIVIYCVFWLKDLIDQDVRDAPPCQRWFGSPVFEKYKQLQTHPETDKILKIWKFNFDLKELAQLYFSRWFCSSSKIITKCMGLVHANQNYVMTVMRKDWMMGRHLKSIWYPDNCGFVSDVATVFLIISSILILHHQPGWRVVADRKVFVPHIMITMIVSILRQRDGAGWLTHISLRATAENWVSSFLSFYCRR